MTAHFRESVDLDRADIVEFDLNQNERKSGPYRAFGKRSFDVFFVLAVAPLGALLVLGAALATWINGQSPFYWQDRVGRNGRVFRMLKIKSMVDDAETVLKDYLSNNPAARAEWDKKQKLTDDPRVTRLGEFLRKTSLDEMPQLWNVLKGDMSIVGPRPMMVDQQVLYPGTAYYELRPGITGPWQISDRSHGSFVGRAGFDTEYNRSLSLKNDLSVLARTAGVVLRCTGR